MIKALIREFPVTDILDDMTEEKIRKYAYTKDEVDALIAEAVAEARRIDEASMAKHNREATVISMILGFTALALFVDGLLRLLGIIPPFMDIDIDVLDKIVERVEGDVIDKINKFLSKNSLDERSYRCIVFGHVCCGGRHDFCIYVHDDEINIKRV